MAGGSPEHHLAGLGGSLARNPLDPVLAAMLIMDGKLCQKIPAKMLALERGTIVEGHFTLLSQTDFLRR
jgi:hypothetical protein